MGLRIISLFVGVAALAVYVAIQAGALAPGTVLRALGYVLIGLIFLVGMATCLLIMVAMFGGFRKGNGQQKDTTNPATEPRANKVELPPIIAVRRPRKAGFRDDAHSWIGGLPTLGGIPWPRTSDGAAMHFAAQLDLAELSKVGAGAILPTSGSLAFFVGLESRVIYIPVGAHAPTPPPDDLDVLGNVIGHGAQTRGIAPDERGNVLPHWPVEFVKLDVEAPESLASVNAAMEAHFDISKSAAVSHKALVKERGPKGLYFQDSAWRFAQSLRNCLAAANGSDHAKSITEEVEQWAQSRPRWEPMAKEDVERLTEYHAELRGNSFYKGHHAYWTLDYLFDDTLLAMVRGPDDVFLRLPSDVREIINRDIARNRPSHQIFGAGWRLQTVAEENEDKYLLLQITDGDDIVPTVYSGDVQFFIAPADLAAGRWDAAFAGWESD